MDTDPKDFIIYAGDRQVITKQCDNVIIVIL